MRHSIGFRSTHIVCAIAALSAHLAAQPTVKSANATELVQTLLGPNSGITLVGQPTFVGGASQSGTFTNGPSSTIGFANGIILSSGAAASAGQNYAGQDRPDTEISTPGDAGLNALLGGQNCPTAYSSITPKCTFDAAVLEFRFTSTAPQVFFNYTFSSAEYPRYENSNYNDIFAFYVNGVNYALVPGSNVTVSVNNVNSKVNAKYFRGYNGSGSPSPFGGQTVVFSFTAPVSTTSVNTIRLAIADTADPFLDSAVFIQAQSFGTKNDLQVTGPCPPPTGIVGVPYAGFDLVVAGGTPPYTFTPEPILAPGLSFNKQTLKVSGTPTAAGDYPVTIRVEDSGVGELKQTKTYTCSGAPPIISISPPTTSQLKITGSCAPGALGAGYSVPLAVQGGSGTYRFSYAGPSWLTLSTTSGIATNGVFPLSLSGVIGGAGSFPIRITVTDGNENSAVFNCTVEVPLPIVRISSDCPASSVPQGSNYTYELNASGAVGAVIWSISQGSLPSGLRLIGNRITGIPDGPPGTKSNFSIAASSGDSWDEKSCSMTVTAPAVRLSSGCPGNGFVNLAYGPFPLSATGGQGAGTYSYSINGSLPDGVTLSNGVIAGTPQKAGNYSFSIQVSSGGQSAQSSQCNVTIATQPLDVTGACPPTSQQVGTAVSASFGGNGGQPPYAVSFSGYPGWMTPSATGISGVPPAEGPGGFTVTVKDNAGTIKTKGCSFVVAPKPLPPTQPSIMGTCPASQQSLGTSLNIPLTVSGGAAPYSWSASGVPGLSLTSSSGSTSAVSGNLTQQGPYTLTVTLTDDAGQQATPFRCSFEVGPPPLTITSSAPCPSSSVDFGSQFTQTLTAAGGTPPYSWSATPTDLFSVSAASGSTTTVSGRLIREGAVSLSVRLSDAGGSTPAVYSCPLTVRQLVIPTITVSTSTADLTDANMNPTRVRVTIQLPSPLPVPLTGTVKVVSGPTSAAQINASNGEATFTIPAGSTTQTETIELQRGLVAGAVRVELTSLSVLGRSALTSPAPGTTVTIPSQPPTFNVSVTSSGNGFNIVVKGYSTTRDITGGSVTFSAASDATVENGTLDLTAYNIAQTFASYFAGTQSNANGAFQLTIPISIEGDTTAISSVTVTLRNSAGSFTSPAVPVR